ncbi:GAF domain-containing protein [Kaarinaea lacus]
MALRKILLEGKSRFGVHVGIISRIENNQYHVHAIDTDYSGIKQGDIFTLGDTYCRDVFCKEQTMTFDDVAEISEMLKHPVYLSTQLRAYIGTPLIVDNQIWGTLNFSSRLPKQPVFSPSDFKVIETLAERASKIIETQSDKILPVESLMR